MKPGSCFFIPDRVSREKALQRTTHLGIGAHPDDLEIMALQGILECHGRTDSWFAGITCTNGSGDRKEDNPALTKLVDQRRREQNRAASLGGYSFVAQLGFSSGEIQGAGLIRLERELIEMLAELRPGIIYTHNPADKHPTHVAVLQAVLAALRALPRERRPARLLGCEVWRGLDWLADEFKYLLPIVDRGRLGRRLISVFRSQTAGKNYAVAAEGRRRANATFFQPRQDDRVEQLAFAMDLTSLLEDETLSLSDFMSPLLKSFENDVLGRLTATSDVTEAGKRFGHEDQQ